MYRLRLLMTEKVRLFSAAQLENEVEVSWKNSILGLGNNSMAVCQLVRLTLVSQQLQSL